MNAMFNICCFSILFSAGTLFCMEQAALRRVAEGGLQAGTMNLMFPRAAIHHQHVPGETVVNQFNGEHYDFRQPFFAQVKNSFMSGFLQNCFDISNWPGMCSRLLAQEAARGAFMVLVSIMFNLPQRLYNHIFGAQEQKERESQVALQHLMVESHVLEKIQQIPCQTKEQKNTIKQLQDTHIQRMGQYMQKYGAFLPRTVQP